MIIFMMCTLGASHSGLLGQDLPFSQAAQRDKGSFVCMGLLETTKVSMGTR